MPANTFNEAEKYLLENWQEAGRVEKSMKETRRKYEGICDRVLEAIKDDFKSLDDCENFVKRDGYIAIARKEWQNDINCAFIGIDHLSLEHLWDDNSDHPFVGIWTGTSRKPAMDLKSVRRMFSEVRTILTEEELARYNMQFDCDDDLGPSEYVLWYTLPEERKELRSMLADGDGQKFVDCLISHFRVFASFITVLDEVFSKHEKK